MKPVKKNGDNVHFMGRNCWQKSEFFFNLKYINHQVQVCCNVTFTTNFVSISLFMPVDIS